MRKRRWILELTLDPMEYLRRMFGEFFIDNFRFLSTMIVHLFILSLFDVKYKTVTLLQAKALHMPPHQLNNNERVEILLWSKGHHNSIMCTIKCKRQIDIVYEEPLRKVTGIPMTFNRNLSISWISFMMANKNSLDDRFASPAKRGYRTTDHI